MIEPKSQSIWRAYSYAWITFAFFMLSIVGHWIFGWFSYVDEQSALGQPEDSGGYIIEMKRHARKLAVGVPAITLAGWWLGDSSFRRI